MAFSNVQFNPGQNIFSPAFQFLGGPVNALAGQAGFVDPNNPTGLSPLGGQFLTGLSTLGAIADPRFAPFAQLQAQQLGGLFGEQRQNLVSGAVAGSAGAQVPGGQATGGGAQATPQPLMAPLAAPFQSPLGGAQIPIPFIQPFPGAQPGQAAPAAGAQPAPRPLQKPLTSTAQQGQGSQQPAGQQFAPPIINSGGLAAFVSVPEQIAQQQSAFNALAQTQALAVNQAAEQRAAELAPLTRAGVGATTAGTVGRERRAEAAGPGDIARTEAATASSLAQAAAAAPDAQLKLSGAKERQRQQLLKEGQEAGILARPTVTPPPRGAQRTIIDASGNRMIQPTVINQQGGEDPVGLPFPEVPDIATPPALKIDHQSVRQLQDLARGSMALTSKDISISVDPVSGQQLISFTDPAKYAESVELMKVNALRSFQTGGINQKTFDFVNSLTAIPPALQPIVSAVQAAVPPAVSQDPEFMAVLLHEINERKKSKKPLDPADIAKTMAAGFTQ